MIQFMSWRWTTKPAIHHLPNRISLHKAKRKPLCANNVCCELVMQHFLPGEEHCDEYVEEDLVFGVEPGEGMASRILPVPSASHGAHAVPVYIISAKPSVFLNVLLSALGVLSAMERIVHWVGVRDNTRLSRCAF